LKNEEKNMKENLKEKCSPLKRRWQKYKNNSKLRFVEVSDIYIALFEPVSDIFNIKVYT